MRWRAALLSLNLDVAEESYWDCNTQSEVQEMPQDGKGMEHDVATCQIGLSPSQILGPALLSAQNYPFIR